MVTLLNSAIFRCYSDKKTNRSIGTDSVIFVFTVRRRLGLFNYVLRLMAFSLG